MCIFRHSFPEPFHIRLRSICCLALVAASVPVTANENFLSKPPEEWTEAEALQVLNDSPWARTVTTRVQDTPCDFEHPAYPGLFPEEMARRMDSISPAHPAETVKPDGAEYVVRLISVKPMQAAVERLISLNEKWARYRGGYGLDPDSKPTNMAERWYNTADEITIAVVLKHPDPKGGSFRDYAFENRGSSVALVVRHIFPCAGIRTANGQIHAVTASMGTGEDHLGSGIYMSFPRIVEGKPLITHRDEKLEFRFIANQRVFETTFNVNLADLFDGTETVMHIPSTVDEPAPTTLP
jgi:hypothetical protein